MSPDARDLVAEVRRAFRALAAAEELSWEREQGIMLGAIDEICRAHKSPPARSTPAVEVAFPAGE